MKARNIDVRESGNERLKGWNTDMCRGGNERLKRRNTERRENRNEGTKSARNREETREHSTRNTTEDTIGAKNLKMEEDGNNGILMNSELVDSNHPSLDVRFCPIDQFTSWPPRWKVGTPPWQAGY